MTKDAVMLHRKRVCEQCQTVEDLAALVERSNGMDADWIARIRLMRARVEETRSKLTGKQPRPDEPGGEVFTGEALE
tara:strand:- start:1812 stop:2042 length:231 start_codon:yes stop_codon:yes gene_type:complete